MSRWGLRKHAGRRATELGLVLVFALATPRIALLQVDNESRSRAGLAVRVFDAARVDSQTITRAVAEAGTILRKAGIESMWVLCTAEESVMPAACQQPLAAEELALRIVRRPKSTKGVLGCTQCGAAVEDAKGVGTYATLYADCLDNVPRVDGLLASLMLGHLMAHEIGHLLLPGQDHAGNSIMCPQMRNSDWALAVKGLLVFSASQAAVLDATVRERRRDNLAAHVQETATTK